MYSRIKTHRITFRQIEGIWQDVAGDSGTLADTFESLKIIIDDNTQFCRIIRYYGNIKTVITYRAYGGKITIDIWTGNIQ